jgi:hypothetical protein
MTSALLSSLAPPRLRVRSQSFFGAVFAALLTTLLLIGPPRAVHAQTAFFSAPNRVDMVHDAKRDMIYITNGREVTRYRASTGALWNPFYLALPAGATSGNLSGIDLSPDGDTLAVADRAYSGAEVWIWLIDLNTGVSRRVAFPHEYYEGGSWTVAFGGDGAVLITTQFLGSGWTPMRRYDPATGGTTNLGSVRQNTMVSASADGSIIGYAESNISDGRWGRYRVADGNIVRREWYENGTSWFNYEIAVSRDGSQFAIPTYGGCYIYDANFTRTHIVGTYAGAQPVGVAYDPTGDRVYFAWSTTSQVKAYDTRTMTPVASYEFFNVFDHNGNHAFTEGRLRISRDGSLLFSTVANGVRMVRVKGGALVAHNQVVEAAEDDGRGITLTGTKGDGTPATQFRVVTQPSHGTLSGTAPNLGYTPAPNYNGPDSFTFVAVDGTAESAPATVSIRVRAVNDPPKAGNVTVITNEDTPAPATLQGSDIDSTTLYYVVTSQPTHGTLSGTAPNLTYKPDPDYNGSDSFTYIVRDSSQAQSSTATVTITVNPVNDDPAAVSDTATVDEDTSVSVAVLSNDLDKDGDTLTVTGASGASHGEVTVEGGAVRYTPQADYNGSDSFTYTISDGKGGTATGSVSVTVTAANDAPTAVDDSAVTRKGVAVDVAVLANDSDKDGDALTLASVSPPSSGTASVTAAGTVRYTPTKTFVGTATFTYTVKDPSGTTATATVTVTVNKK